MHHSSPATKVLPRGDRELRLPPRSLNWPQRPLLLGGSVLVVCCEVRGEGLGLLGRCLFLLTLRRVVLVSCEL
jgi:hypothetical protein